MTVRDGFPSATGLADALDVRLDLAGLVVRDTSGNPRTGVFPRNTTALVTSTATMNSSVAAAEFITARSGAGPVFLANDGATNVLHDAAPVANSRYDIIYVKQSDTGAGDGVDAAAFGIFKGTASAGPTPYTYATAKAAIPTGAEPLAMVLIPSTATSMQSGGVVYTQLNRYTACTGGVIWFRNTTDRDTVTYAQGQLAWLMDSKQLQQYNGTAWELVGKVPHILLDRNATAYSLPNNVYTQLINTYLTSTLVVGGSMSGGVITVDLAGVYEISASATFTANATGARQLVVNKNSATVTTNPLLYAGVAGSSTTNGTVAGTKRVVLAAGDQLRLFLYQNSGGTLAMPTATDQAAGTFFDVAYVSAA